MFPSETWASATVNAPVPEEFKSTGKPSSRKRIVTGLGIYKAESKENSIVRL